MDSKPCLNEAVKSYIYSLDLSLLKVKTMFEKGWDEEKFDNIEKKYKNFLYLQWKYRKNMLLVPTIDIDEMWHGHILDTKSYREHTQFIYGEYLDHDPYGEVDDGENVDRLVNAFMATQKIYYQEFGEEY